MQAHFLKALFWVFLGRRFFFFTAAYLVLYFKRLTKTVLLFFSVLLKNFYSAKVFSVYHFVIPVEKAEGEQEAGKGHSSRTADLNSPQGCSRPYSIRLSSKIERSFSKITFS